MKCLKPMLTISQANISFTVKACDSLYKTLIQYTLCVCCFSSLTVSSTMTWRSIDLIRSECINAEQLKAILPKIKEQYNLFCCSKIRTVFFIYTTNYRRAEDDDDTASDSDCSSVCSAHYSKIVFEHLPREEALPLIDEICEELCTGFVTGDANEVIANVCCIEEILESSILSEDILDR